MGEEDQRKTALLRAVGQSRWGLGEIQRTQGRTPQRSAEEGADGASNEDLAVQETGQANPRLSSLSTLGRAMGKEDQWEDVLLWSVGRSRWSFGFLRVTGWRSTAQRDHARKAKKASQGLPAVPPCVGTIGEEDQRKTALLRAVGGLECCAGQVPCPKG